jgi:hypothetical protein
MAMVRLVMIVMVLAAASACRGGDVEPDAAPAGREQTAKTTALEAGATVIQDVAPVGRINVYLVGFHPMKDEPSHQMESHHYCNQVNEDFAQCVLFDGNTPEANLHGIEYIISERLFESLPPEEQQYWHPHNYEILSGALVAPGLPDVAERALMEQKINSYGKTWHVWMTGVHGRQGDRLPFGPAHLAWSFNRDGEADPEMVRVRDERMGVDSAEKRRQREPLAELARPQRGVAALADRFPKAGGAPKGVAGKD